MGILLGHTVKSQKTEHIKTMAEKETEREGETAIDRKRNRQGYTKGQRGTERARCRERPTETERDR